MATQHVERNLLLNLYREENICWFVSSCRLREITMSGTCSLLPPPGAPWPSCLLPSQLTCREWGASHWKSSYHFHCDQTCLFLCGLFIFSSDMLESPFRKIGLLHMFSFPWVSVPPVLSRVVSDCSKGS